MLGDRFDEVLLAARAGGDWAWAELYGDLAPTVRGYLRGKGAVDPDDVTGEVFLQVVRSLHTFEGDEAGFRSWVFTIAHRRMIDARRVAGRRRDEAVAPDELPDLDAHPGHEAEVIRRLTAEEITAVLDRLKPAYRDVLLLRFLGGLTIAECGDVLGKRLSATKALLRRALSALRAELADGEYPSEG